MKPVIAWQSKPGLGVQESLAQIQKLLVVQQPKRAVQKLKGRNRTLNRKAFKYQQHSRMGKWFPFHGERPLEDTQINLGLPKIDTWNKKADYDSTVESHGRNLRFALTILVEAVNEATAFYSEWGKHPWVWKLQHDYETEKNAYGKEAEVPKLYRVVAAKQGLDTYDVRYVHSRFQQAITNCSYLRIMYGHLDWLIESVGGDREDLLDQVHRLADGDRILGVSEPDIRVLDLPYISEVRKPQSVANTRRKLSTQFL